MSDDARARRHERLLAGMAQSLGIDIETAEQSGLLNPEDKDRLLTACMGCTRPDACAARLSVEERMSEAPDYCRNKKPFAQMASPRTSSLS